MSVKPILIILSDLWGREKSDWIAHYNTHLENDFEITYYDCCELGELDKVMYDEQNLHTQFVNSGIEKAIVNLNQIEKRKVTILAFSVGGYIGWKASLLGLKTQNLFAVSSTRLRLEIEKPNCNIELFYGENDLYRPKNNWFESMTIEKQIIQNGNHNLYQNREFAKSLSKMIIGTLKPNG